MSDDEVTSSSAKLPVWDGKNSSVATWIERFRAYAVLKKFLPAIGTTREPNLPAKEADTIDKSNDTGKKQAAAKWRNQQAMASLTMAFKNEEQMTLIKASKTQDWPNGLACLVMKQILDVYQPGDVMAKAELEIAMGQVSMKDKEDPDNLFKRIAVVEARYCDPNQGSAQLPVDKIVATVVQKAPEMYRSTIAAMSNLA